jgi:hypothetical protein
MRIIHTSGNEPTTTTREDKTMYRISSTNDWFNGQRFDSLVAAKERADSIVAKGEVADVLIDADGETMRVVYTPAACVAGQAVRGTYAR